MTISAQFFSKTAHFKISVIFLLHHSTEIEFIGLFKTIDCKERMLGTDLQPGEPSAASFLNAVHLSAAIKSFTDSLQKVGKHLTDVHDIE